MALNSLASNEDNRVVISEHGGIKAVVDAMKLHASNADLQEQGCWALLDIGRSGRSKRVLRQQIKDAGGAAVVKAAMSAPNALPDTKKFARDLLNRLSKGRCRYGRSCTRKDCWFEH